MTKDHLSAEVSRFATELAAQRAADRKVLDQRLQRIAFALPIEMVVALAAVVAVTEWLRG